MKMVYLSDALIVRYYPSRVDRAHTEATSKHHFILYQLFEDRFNQAHHFNNILILKTNKNQLV